MFPGDDEPRVPEPGDEDGSTEPVAGDDEFESGLTEEFERMERELDEDLDDAGEWDAPEGADDADTADDGAETEAPASAWVPEGLSDPEPDEPEPGDATDQEPEPEPVNVVAYSGKGAEEPPAVAEEPAEEPAEATEEEPEPAAEEPTETPETDPGPVAEEPSPATEKPGRATRIWPRFFAATLAIIGSMAAATAISFLLILDSVASDFGGIRGLQPGLANVRGGDPQNILILGSDKRPGDGVKGRSDTTLLVRVDPETDAIALLSIPRDLKVNIPGYGTDKFNVAYSLGGPKLTLEVTKELLDIDINHVINIDFTGFADAVDAIDCVYLDVDRHYFNDNSLAATTLDQYAEIDVEAGYQRLCGYNALQYVRYRHEDTDLVRAARQQDFLREARQKIDPKKLFFDADYRNRLIDVFGKYTTSDDELQDPIELLALIKTFIAARGAPVSEVHFPAQLGGPTDPYVTADNDAIAAAVDQFEGTQGTPGPSPTGEAEEPSGDGGGGGDGGDGKPKPDKPQAEPEDAEGLTGSADSGEAYAKILEDVERKDGDPMVEFPIFYPTRMLAGSTLNDASRAFPIDGPGNDVYHGYKMVAGFPGMGGFTEYYGFSGTDWKDAPILENPSEVRRIDGRDYMLFFDGDRLRLVGWKTDKAAYWVINTLTQTLDNNQMISMATGMRELGG